MCLDSELTEGVSGNSGPEHLGKPKFCQSETAFGGGSLGEGKALRSHSHETGTYKCDFLFLAVVV